MSDFLKFFYICYLKHCCFSTLDQIREHEWLKLTFDIENSEFPDIWMSEEPIDLQKVEKKS